MEWKYKLLKEEVLEDKLSEKLDLLDIETRERVVSACIDLLQRDIELYNGFNQLIRFLDNYKAVVEEKQLPNHKVVEEVDEEVVEGGEDIEEVDLEKQQPVKKFVVKKKTVM